MSLIRLLVLLIAVLAAAPLSAQQAAEGPNGTITAERDAATDAAIAVRIREILTELGGYEDVTVTVAEGIVTLRGTTASTTEATGLTDLVTRIENVVAIKNEVTETTDIVRRLNPAINRFTARLDQLVTILPLFLIAVSVFVSISSLGWLISSRRQPWNRIAPNMFIADLYRQIIMIVFVVIALVVALDILNASALLGTILGAAGIVGLAFGFAVRDTVENYIASIMLSIRQPFRPNDTIEINGDEGKVIRLTSRATILMSFDGNQIRIPNATVFKSRIVNFSQNAERRFMFTITIPLHSDLNVVRDLATTSVQNLPFVLDAPAAVTWISDFNDAGIELVVTGWIDQNETSMVLARGEALRSVKLAIEASGLALPEKSYRLNLSGSPAEMDLEPTPVPPQRQLQPTASIHVADNIESELDKIIEAERTAEMNEDLLRTDAPNE